MEARAANVLWDQQQKDRATRLLAPAHDELVNPGFLAWPGFASEVCAGLAKTGRVDVAVKLEAALANPWASNDALDAISCALIDAGALEEAAVVLKKMAPFDPWSQYSTHCRVHWAQATLADAFIERGDWERAAEFLDDREELMGATAKGPDT